MPEPETRMSRLHGKKAGTRKQAYQDYVKGEPAPQDKRTNQDWPPLPTTPSDWDQTQVYRTDDWAQEDPYAYHEVTELLAEVPDEAYSDGAYDDAYREDYTEDYREAYDEAATAPVQPQATPPKVKRPFSRRLDRFLNNALILVTVLLLVVLVIMFVL